MKTLFIAKEKQPDQFSILIQRQINSLETNENSLQLTKFICKGTGFSGYISIYKYLKRFLKQNDFDVLHAHYSFIGLLAILASKKKNVVVSFMGTDIFSNALKFRIARWYILKKATHIIVKSERMLEKLSKQNNISVIPNGLDLEVFQPIDKTSAKRSLGWDNDKFYVIFPAGKNRYEKNFSLAQQAITELSKKHPIEIHLLENVKPEDVPIYLNAADIVLLTSRWEGSSNVTKEAMACNTVVVSTDVGDASELFSNTEGYFITDQNVKDVVLKLKQAIAFLNVNNSTQGRRRILELGLDDFTTAKKLLDVYRKIIQ